MELAKMTNNSKEVVVKFLDGGGFDVHFDGKSTGLLSYDEMLGIVSSICMPEVKRNLAWLQSPEQHEAYRNRRIQRMEQNNG